MIYSSEQFRGNIRVEAHAILQPLTESHKYLDHVNDRSFFVKSFNSCGHFYELIGSGGRFFQRGVGGQIFEQYVNRVQELVNQ